MGGLVVRQLDGGELKQFVMLPFRLYKDDPNWVAPLITSQMKMLKGGSRFLAGSEHSFLMAYRDGKPCARTIVGKYNGMKQYLQGCCYFSLTEASDPEALKAMMAAVEDWAKLRGISQVAGPISPTDGEDDRCFLIDGFEGPPTLMGTYNPSWYGPVMDGMGYEKAMDLYTFLLSKGRATDERIARALALALKRSRMFIDHAHMKDAETDFRSIFEVVKACAKADPELPDPTWDQFIVEARDIAKLADERLIWIARKGEERKPVAFVVCMPNWSEILKRIRGRLFPFGWIHAIGAKKRIKGIRALMQFCLPEYHGSGIMSVLYAKILEEALAAGYEYGEAGIIKDDNFGSRRPIEAIGGKHYRTYRWYMKRLDQ